MTVHLDDVRWRSANAAHLVDEPSAVDPAWVRDYAPQDPEVAAEKALLDALHHASPPAHIDDAAVIAGALAQWDPPEAAAAPSRPRWARRAAVVTGLLAVGVAAGLLLAVGPWSRGAGSDAVRPTPGHASRSVTDEAPAPLPPAADDKASVPAPDPGALAVAPAEPPAEPPAAPWTVRSGRVMAKDLDARPTALPRGLPLVAAGRVCTASDPKTEICLQDGSRFELSDDDRITLAHGRAHVRTDGGRPLSVQVDDMRIEAEGPAVYIIEREVAGWSLTVNEGAPVMHTAQAHTTVQAGQTLMGKAPRTRARRATPDPRQRLASARAVRAAGDREGAAEIYEALIAASPRSPVARVATVSLGQLYLELGRPAKAREAFERYLSRGPGTLTEDAAFGRLRALRALGAPAFAAAAREFVARHQDGAYADRVRRWID